MYTHWTHTEMRTYVYAQIQILTQYKYCVCNLTVVLRTCPFLLGPTPQQRSHLPTSLHQQKRRQSVWQTKIVGNRGSLSESSPLMTSFPNLLHEFLSIFSKLLHDWDHDRMSKNRQYKHIFRLTKFSHDIPNHHIQSTPWMSWTSITYYLNIHNMFCSHFQITTRNYPPGNVDDHKFRLPVPTVTL